MIGRPRAAVTIRAAPAAIALSWLSTDRISVSSTTHSAKVAGNGQDRRAGEEQLALGVPVDVAGEVVVRRASRRWSRRRCRPCAGSRCPAASKRKSRISSISRPGPGDHAVAAAGGQPPGEHLEDAAAVGRAVLEGGADHGQLVLVGQQRGREVGHAPTLLRQRCAAPGARAIPAVDPSLA